MFNQWGDDTRARVLRLLAKKFRVEIDSLSDNMRFLEDLKVDSLDLIELSVIIGTEFGHDIPDDKMSELKTISLLVGYLETNLVNTTR